MTAASIVVSSFALFRFVFSPTSGRLVDAFGERRIYITGLLIVAASTAAVAFAQNYWRLLVFRGLGGIGSTMFTVSAMALIIRLAPVDARAKASSTYATAFLVGNIAGPVLGGLMAGWGMRVPFIIYAAGLVVAAAVVRIFLASTASAGSATKLGRARIAAAADLPAQEVMTFRQAWQDSAYRAALVSAFVQGWSAMGIRVAIYPLFAIQAPRADTAAAGLALTMFALGNAAPSHSSAASPTPTDAGPSSSGVCSRSGSRRPRSPSPMHSGSSSPSRYSPASAPGWPIPPSRPRSPTSSAVSAEAGGYSRSTRWPSTGVRSSGPSSPESSSTTPAIRGRSRSPGHSPSSPPRTGSPDARPAREAR